MKILDFRCELCGEPVDLSMQYGCIAGFLDCPYPVFDDPVRLDIFFEKICEMVKTIPSDDT